MLRSLHDLEDYTIAATDGDIGTVKDFYFDDQAWVIRYLIVETGSWLLSRKVLISPTAVHHPDWSSRRLPVAIDKAQVKASPDIDTEKPVSRQHEMQYLTYYGYPYYWGSMDLWSTSPGGEEQTLLENAQRQAHEDDDPHLRSCKALIGYHIKARGEEVGHVDSLLVNEDTWAVQYLVVNTGHWWSGHKVLIAPEWIEDVSWLDRHVSLDLDRETVRTSPHYESSEQLNREREASLYEHYGRSGYWQVETTLLHIVA